MPNLSPENHTRKLLKEAIHILVNVKTVFKYMLKEMLKNIFMMFDPTVYASPACLKARRCRTAGEDPTISTMVSELRGMNHGERSPPTDHSRRDEINGDTINK